TGRDGARGGDEGKGPGGSALPAGAGCAPGRRGGAEEGRARPNAERPAGAAMNRLLVIACLVASSTAIADDVSPEIQAKAEALLAEGNELFAKRAHEAALEKFKQGLALWDHPLLHFN